MEDGARGIDFILKNGLAGEIYNLAGQCELTNNNLTHFILEIFKKEERSIQRVTDRPAHDFRYGINTEKLKRLGYKIKPPFKNQLNETIRWYQENPAWWKPLKTDQFTLK